MLSCSNLQNPHPRELGKRGSPSRDAFSHHSGQPAPITGVDILMRIDNRPRSRLIGRLTFLPYHAHAFPAANRCFYSPWSCVGPQCYPRSPVVKRNRDLSDIVVCSRFLSELEEKHSNAM